MRIHNWISILIFSILVEVPINKDYPDCIPYVAEFEEVNEKRVCSPYNSKMAFYSKSTSKAYLNTFPEVLIKLSYWTIHRQDGTSDNLVDSLKINESIEVLNRSFEPLKIQFELKSFKTINDSLHYWTSLSKISSFASRTPKYIDTTAINIYIPFRFTNFKNNLRGAQLNSRSVAINSFEYNTGILVHEIGHVFDLKHTHQSFKSKICERVTRNENDPNYNADCTGDYVKDTGAMRELNNNRKYISEDCNYMGNLKDCDGTPYQMGPSEIRNFMSYTLQHCRDRFTTGQMIRVREYIKNDPKDVVHTFLAQ